MASYGSLLTAIEKTLQELYGLDSWKLEFERAGKVPVFYGLPNAASVRLFVSRGEYRVSKRIPIEIAADVDACEQVVSSLVYELECLCKACGV